MEQPFSCKVFCLWLFQISFILMSPLIQIINLAYVPLNQPRAVNPTLKKWRGFFGVVSYAQKCANVFWMQVESETEGSLCNFLGKPHMFNSPDSYQETKTKDFPLLIVNSSVEQGSFNVNHGFYLF